MTLSADIAGHEELRIPHRAPYIAATAKSSMRNSRDAARLSSVAATAAMATCVRSEATRGVRERGGMRERVRKKRGGLETSFAETSVEQNARSDEKSHVALTATMGL